MNIIPDTNVLVRAVVRDDSEQTRKSDDLLRKAAIIAVPLSSLCELVWVLRGVYEFGSQAIAFALDRLLMASNVLMDRPAVEAGISFVKAGGDFADGIIAYEGSSLGGETFVSFDRKAVRLAKAQGYDARLL